MSESAMMTELKAQHAMRSEDFRIAVKLREKAASMGAEEFRSADKWVRVCFERMNDALNEIVRQVRSERINAEARVQRWIDTGSSDPVRRWMVDYIQACEIDCLPQGEGIEIEVEPEVDDMGFHRVAVIGESPEQVIAYVREHWGDDDRAWFHDHIENRIASVIR